MRDNIVIYNIEAAHDMDFEFNLRQWSKFFLWANFLNYKFEKHSPEH